MKEFPLNLTIKLLNQYIHSLINSFNFWSYVNQIGFYFVFLILSFQNFHFISI